MEVGQKELGRGDKEWQQEGEGDSLAGGTSDHDMPVIQQEVWREEDIDDMPVLQKMVDLPSRPAGRKLRSPPPPPLQITLSLTNTPVKHSRCLKVVSRKGKDIDKGSQTGGNESCGSQHHSRKKSHKHKKLSKPLNASEKCSNIRQACDKTSEESDLKQKNSHQCHAKSALTELIDLNHSTSPSVARSIEGDPVVSFEHDTPMEPDSTSEFGLVRWRHARKESEISRGEVSPFGEVSPHSAGCAGPATPSSQECTMRVEENLAECDSTSMFIASPSAISPASHGEIEERVCPVLADREDRSPAHCVCRCRSLPPPPDLVTRDHTHSGTVTIESHHAVTPAAARPPLPRIRTRLVRSHSVDDEPAPNLEKVAPCLELMAAPGDVLQGENESPPVLTLPEEEIRGQQFRIEHSDSADIPPEENQQEAPPLVKYGPESTPRSSRSNSSCDDGDKSPPVLTLLGQETSSKPRKKSVELVDFTNNIDWHTAVVETVMGPPTVEQDGEKKPGIVIKIRTKAVVPSVKGAPKEKAVASVSRIQRKRHNVDNSEVISRLRKRHKPEEVSKLAEVTQRDLSQGYCVDSKTSERSVQTDSASSKTFSCFYQPHPASQAKKQRRNEVQVGKDLKAHTHLSLADHSVVQTFMELSRLQCLTHVLVNGLFPRLQPQLSITTPESLRFTRIIDDIIFSLEQSESELRFKECEDLNEMFEKLTLSGDVCLPVYSPRIVLCRSPQHLLHDFREKVCRMLQLLLPNLIVSITNTISHSSHQLENILRKIIAANKTKAAKKKLLTFRNQ